jgi:hypothetical protein
VAEPKNPERRGPSNPNVTGPTRSLNVFPTTAPVRRGAPETTRPVTRPDLVTDGMKAHRREIERRKRQASIEKMHQELQSADTRRSIWRWTFWVVLVLVAGFGYQRLQSSYGNQWPIWNVWILLAIGLFGSIAWLIWYMNRTDM